MSFGSDQLHWMVIDACNSLLASDESSLNANNIRPFNSNLHLLLGFNSDTWDDVPLESIWAGNMLGGMKVIDAWYAAGGGNTYPQGIPSPVSLAVWGWSNCTDDSLQTNAPAGGNAYYDSRTVH